MARSGGLAGPTRGRLDRPLLDPDEHRTGLIAGSVASVAIRSGVCPMAWLDTRAGSTS